MSFSSLIVQREIATIRQVEEALARQVLYGGDLATNLLEVAPIEEGTLLGALAESMGREPASPGTLPAPSPEALRLIPQDLASQKSILPLVLEGDTLVLVTSELYPKEEEEQLAFALGVKVVTKVAIHPRVREAITSAYGVPLDRRMERLLGKLRDRDAGVDSGRASQFSEPPPLEPPRPQPQSAPPFKLSPAYGTPVVKLPSRTQTNMGFPLPPRVLEIPIGEQAHPEVHAAVTVPPSEAAIDLRKQTGPHAVDASFAVTAPPARTFLKATQNAVRPVRRRRGPLTFDIAKEELEAAADRDTLLDLFFEFARQYFDYSALFIAHGDLAEGRDAFGDGASREQVVGIGVPLDLPSMFQSARDKREAVFTVLSAEGVDGILAHDLERKPGIEAVAMPVLVRGRAVAVLYADAGESGIDREAIREVTTFASMAGQGFERLIVRKKLSGFSGGSAATGAGRVDIAVAGVATKRPTSRPPPSKAERAEALTRALGAEPRAASDRPGAFRPLPPPSAESLALGPHKPPTNPETPQARGPIPPVLDPGSSPPPPPGSPDKVVVPVDAKISAPPRASPSKPPPPGLASVRVPQGPPIPRVEPEEREDEADAESPIALVGPRISAPAIDAVNVDDEEAAALLEEIERAEAEMEMAGSEPTTMDLEEGESAPSSVVIPPHRPPSARGRTPSLALPSVIVDMDQELLVLVDRVAFGQDDGQAEGELLRQGQHAMPAIMARFPGPVSIDRSQLAPPLPKASECGAILRLVARQRRVALPFVLQAAAEEDTGVRFWATFLLAELAYVDSVPLIVARLYDADPRVRMAARVAAKSTSDAAHEALLAEIGKVLRDPSAARGARIGVIEALGEMREPLAVPVLIRSLGDKDEEIATVARRSLIAITRQDYQRDEKKWLAWWGQNSARHRIEWLIDALGDDTPGIRRAAGDELKALTSETFGYYDDLPKRERDRAQQRFRDWWSQEGKAKFVRPV